MIKIKLQYHYLKFFSFFKERNMKFVESSTNDIDSNCILYNKRFSIIIQ